MKIPYLPIRDRSRNSQGGNGYYSSNQRRNNEAHNTITLPRGLIADAHQNPGAGIHIAKLLLKVSDLDGANESWDIFKDASSQTNKGSAYAAYTRALVKLTAA